MVFKWTISIAATVADPNKHTVLSRGNWRALIASKTLRIVGRKSGKEKNAVKARR